MIEHLIEFLDAAKVVAVTDSEDYGRITIIVPRSYVHKVSVDDANQTKQIYTEALKVLFEAQNATKQEVKELRNMINSISASMKGMQSGR